MIHWYEDEAFWKATYPFMFPESRMDSGMPDVERVLMLAGIVKGEDLQSGPAMDLCCGPGRHSVALARKGFAVTGVDRSPLLLDKARLLAREEGIEIEWIHSDMREFRRPGAFSLALNLFTSFGYFESRDEDFRVLKRVYENLAPGGVFVMELLSKENLAGAFEPTCSKKLEDGGVIVQRHEIVDDWDRVINEWIVVRDGRAATFRFHLNLYSGHELKEALLRAGFGAVRLFGGLDGDAYDHLCDRTAAVAVKT